MLLTMGQSTSAPKSRRRSLKSPFSKRKEPLSHTFNLHNGNMTNGEQLNVNIATEEELMTLPGINREIARNIVRHRESIRRFKKVGDLALVAGVGAEKLDRIRGEICTANNNSRAQSLNSLQSSDSRTVDVNKASVFDLQKCVPGMSQEMAANIIHYREKKGEFKSVDDLVKVKSINQMKLNNMSYYLTVGDNYSESSLSRTTSASEVLSNGYANGHCNGNVTKQRKSSTLPTKLNMVNGLLSPTSLSDIYDMLSAYSYRPIPEEDFQYSRDGKFAVRIATWNLDNFTSEKAANLGVREVICRTILEHKISLVCLQDVIDESALLAICEELNFPKLRRVQDFRSNSNRWEYKYFDSNLAYLYDLDCAGIGVQLMSSKELISTDICKVTIGHFELGPLQLKVLNVFADEMDGNDLPIVDKLEECTRGCDNLVIFGDFTNSSIPERKQTIGKLKSILPVDTNTSAPNLDDKCFDNVFISPGMKQLLTGKYGVIKQGLTHLAIPNGWSWGGTVSTHCPIYTEFYLRESVKNI